MHSPASVHTILWLPNPGNTIVNVSSATPQAQGSHALTVGETHTVTAPVVSDDCAKGFLLRARVNHQDGLLV